jgi:hypothetical protein
MTKTEIITQNITENANFKHGSVAGCLRNGGTKRLEVATKYARTKSNV